MRTSRTGRLLALALSSLLVLTACGGDEDGATEPSPEPTTAEPSDTETPTETPSPTDEPANPTEARSVEAVPEGQELLLRTTDGEVEVIYTLDPEGESFFVSAAARPGSTADDATIVTVTQAEGMYDLRWLDVTGGQAGDLQLFDEPYRPASDMAPVDSVGPTVAWSPGGQSIGWIEWDAGGETTLRTIGWDGGPGTGDDATDNASFGVEPIPAGSRIQSWTATGDSTSEITVSGPEGNEWTVSVERQADGALALRPDAVQEA